MAAKYNIDPADICPPNPRDRGVYWIWRDILKTFDLKIGEQSLRDYCIIQVGNGKRVKFWQDLWIGNHPLMTAFPRMFALAVNKEGTVADFGTKTDSGWVWDIQFRRNAFGWEREPFEELFRLLVEFDRPGSGFDKFKWKGTSDGSYTAKVAEALQFPSRKADFDWKALIWQGFAPYKVEAFVWRVLLRRVPVRSELVKSGIVLAAESCCPMCSDGIIHLAMIWLLWLHRNELVFNGKKLDVKQVLFSVKVRVVCWLEAKFQRLNWWHLLGAHPPPGSLKFNVDGAVRSDGGVGGIRGVLRNNSASLSRFIALNRSVNYRLVIESDCEVLVNWLLNVSMVPGEWRFFLLLPVWLRPSAGANEIGVMVGLASVKEWSILGLREKIARPKWRDKRILQNGLVLMVILGGLLGISMIPGQDSNNLWGRYAGPGRWNDPDMLEVGNGGMSIEEYRSHFSIWALMKAPLLIGCDVRTLSKRTLSILGNKEVIDVNQDSLGPLLGKRVVVVLWNRSQTRALISVGWREIGLSPSSLVAVRDLWNHSFVWMSKRYRMTAAEACKMYIMTAVRG
ncbi:Alpha-galactosidase [Hibiscus syriacus]|uniref:Alpha-galactosidase n=1 Tax=Hibiscus syriacus TaxID=106335 RepID=A0A6A3BIU3_HIBSY|nr:Alpha-galactosidase [Hibiscus syriacus]